MTPSPWLIAIRGERKQNHASWVRGANSERVWQAHLSFLRSRSTLSVCSSQADRSGRSGRRMGSHLSQRFRQIQSKLHIHDVSGLPQQSRAAAASHVEADQEEEGRSGCGGSSSGWLGNRSFPQCARARIASGQLWQHRRCSFLLVDERRLLDCCGTMSASFRRACFLAASTPHHALFTSRLSTMF